MSNPIKDVIKSAAQSLSEFRGYDECEAAVALICKAEGPLLISGVGKSGHIARKMASTFRSLGKEAHFIHAAEASHGDLGCFVKGAVVMLLSNSGETSELSDIVNFCRLRDNPMIAITSQNDSTIAKAASVVIAYGNIDEGDPNGLAPTSSTTLSLAIGDAIAVGYASAMSFKLEDFAHFHPRGRLGARLQRVGDIMRTSDQLPIVAHDADMKTVVLALSQKSLGIAILMDGDHVKGILTDGDLRRHIDHLWDKKPMDIATQKPKTITRDVLIGDAIGQMSEIGVTQLLVMDATKLCGLIHMHDGMKS